ncbi:MAG UNVERIFIED_CONTAM: nitroreductase family protein [Planctomycetaceae bacterium]|jgi:hypothetical protein
MSQSTAIIDSLLWRRAVKNFDPSRTIPADTWQTLEQSLLLSPSSYGLQPWKFFVITSPAIKQLLPDAAWGQTQPRDCSHFVVIAARRTVDADFVQSYIDRFAAIRGTPRKHSTDSAMPSLAKPVAWAATNCRGPVDNATSPSDSSSNPLHSCTWMPARWRVSFLTVSMDSLQFPELRGPVSSPAALGYRSPNDTSDSEPKVRFDAADVIAHC